ncbi:aminopeptidase [Blautia faecis]|uniref:aminopeptidase n=1 Tax=Blautia faecis TaxID=871665 RepID=UPI001C02268C|nr:aminopeptidase [Blautia faecis]MBT9856421.1 aminopeptidase [Blautia faecis]
MERPNAWLTYSDADMQDLETVAKKYRHFLNVGKTERECITQIVKEAEEAGYVSLEEKVKNGEDLKAGDKVYQVGMQKIIALYHIGEDDLAKGMNILCAHIDSPRLDIKQNPLYEDTDLAYLDTHYYGGVKKYQWVALPMAMHGVIAKKDGTVVNVTIGEDEDDPVVYITDLLIHLAGQQMAKKASEAVEGEKLDILIGSQPLKDLPDDKKKEAVKENVLRILNEKYGVEEEDFLSAELEIVPAGKARDCGLDRSMIAGYGQDDRVCAYTSLLALLEMEAPKRTSCCLLVDKEEIGSVGATGMQSHFFENSVAEVLDAMGQYSDLRLRKALKNSSMLSSDVSAGYDPAFAEAFEKKNSAYLGRGIVLNKFTGARGKSGSNDANAEYVARVRRIFDDHKVCFQTAELGKVDVGGGGTIAFIAALYGMEVIDSGVSVLSMHAPWEVTSKADVYEAKKAYKAFLLDA